MIVGKPGIGKITRKEQRLPFHHFMKMETPSSLDEFRIVIL